MTYGTEAMIPVESSLLSPRVACLTQGHNDEGMVGSLDALEKQKDIMSI